MEDKEAQILTEFVEGVSSDIKASLKAAGRYATGNTEKAFEIALNGNSVELSAPGYIDILERGRGPTSPDAEPADPSVLSRIKEWCIAKGIDEKAAFAITKSIHKYGYKGKQGVITVPLDDENVQKRAKEAAGKLASLLITNCLTINKP